MHLPNKNILQKSKRNSEVAAWTAIVGVFSLVLLLILDSQEWYAAGCVFFCGWGLVYSCCRLKERFALFSFNMGFFIFLISGFLFRWLDSGKLDYFSGSQAAVVHGCLSLYLCMLTVNMSYIVLQNKKQEVEEQAKAETEAVSSPEIPLIVRQMVVCLLVFSFLCALLVEYRTTQILQTSTYADKMSVSTGLPSVITSGASLYYISLFMFWAMFPSKMWTWLSIGSLAILEFIILRSGERGEPISLLLTALFYIFLRNRRGLTNVRIPKKAAVIGLLLVPFALYGLQAMSYTRVNKEYDASALDGMVEFFETQGGSANIVSNGYDYRDRIADIGGRAYTIGTVRNYFTNNVFARLLFDFERTGRTTVGANIAEAHSYLVTYGYVHSPYTFSKNVGGGSTYVAEVYHDGGYVFLVIFNAFIALLLSKLDRAKGNSVISVAILLNVFRYMPLLPRGVALQWLTSTFAIQNLLIFIVIWFLTKQAKAQTQYSPLARS